MAEIKFSVQIAKCCGVASRFVIVSPPFKMIALSVQHLVHIIDSGS